MNTYFQTGISGESKVNLLYGFTYSVKEIKKEASHS